MADDPQRYLGAYGEVRREHAVELDRVDAFMRRNVDGYEGPPQVQQFKGGQSNPTYLLTTPGARYVVRRKPAGALESAHAIDREFRVISALHRIGFPVPRPFAYCADADVIGTPFYVMGYVEGRVFYDCSMPDLGREERGAIFDAVNETLARLHKIDLDANGLADFGRPGNYFARQVSRWSRQYEASKTRDIPEMDKLIAWLPGAVPEQNETCLLHGDYSFHNVIVHPTEPRVLALLDWELSTTGDPFGDLMYHAMDWYRPPGVSGRGQLSDKDPRALGVPTLEEYIARYCARTGREPPRDPGFYKAFNLFRTAAIVQGIVKRYLGGTASNANAGEQEARVAPLAKAAWRFAQESGAT
jgi:aminoglycoside phosphotransferase (APT) family kinase protein